MKRERSPEMCAVTWAGPSPYPTITRDVRHFCAREVHYSTGAHRCACGSEHGEGK